MDGRKIPRDAENPFDNVFIDVASWLNVHVFRPLHFTPNIITTMSLLTGLVSLIFFYHQRYIEFVIVFLVSYILDCADGNYARRYSMVTPFGDLYDHFSDVAKITVLILLVYVHPIPLRVKIAFYLALFVLGFLSNVHLGCQERMYNTAESPFLSPMCNLCPSSPSSIYVTRYIGVGTLQVAIAAFGIYLYSI